MTFTVIHDQERILVVIVGHGNDLYMTTWNGTDTTVQEFPGAHRTQQDDSWSTTLSPTHAGVPTNQATSESSAGIATTNAARSSAVTTREVLMDFKEITEQVSEEMQAVAQAWAQFVEAFREQALLEDAIMARAGSMRSDNSDYALFPDKVADPIDIALLRAGRMK